MIRPFARVVNKNDRETDRQTDGHCVDFDIDYKIYFSLNFGSMYYYYVYDLYCSVFSRINILNNITMSCTRLPLGEDTGYFKRLIISSKFTVHKKIVPRSTHIKQPSFRTRQISLILRSILLIFLSTSKIPSLYLAWPSMSNKFTNSKNRIWRSIKVKVTFSKVA